MTGRRPWPARSFCTAAPLNPRRERRDIDWARLDTYPTVADKAAIWLAMRPEAGEQS